MSTEMIELLIKWGPLAIMFVVFATCFVVGLIRGTYKVMRRLIYVVLYVILVWIFIDNITDFALDLNITINGIKGVREFITNFITSNEAVNNFLKYSPELKDLIIEHPQIIISPLLFVVLVLVGLPLSFPIYWVYILIFNLIAKMIFKRKKYARNEQGEILRNEKGKKVKIKRKKHRLLGGFLRGAQGVVLVGVALMPVNFVNRIYNKAKGEAQLEDNETLCGSIEFAEVNEDFCKYLDVYNETIFAKIGGEKSLDKFVNDSLTTVDVDGESVSLEKELSNVAVSAVLLNESGIMSLFKDGKFDLDNADFSKIDFDKINLAIDQLFNSYTLARLVEAGVGYALNEVLNDNLVELLKDEDIVSKLEYSNSDEIKEELKDVVNILKLAVEKNLDDLIIDNRDNVVTIVNGVNASDVEALLNKVLNLRIINKAMPSILKAYGEKYGVNVPSDMSEELNGEISGIFANAVKFVQTMELVNIDEIKEGNIVENIGNKLFVAGAMKADSKESLATLLHELNSSYLFKDVVSEQINKLLEKSDIKVDARVIKYVDSKEAWLKELKVLETAYDLYDEYKNTDQVNYDNVTELLNELTGTKVLISVLPFTYDYLLPKIGIEIDSEGLPIIDFDGEKENISKIAFYNTWEEELVLLNNIADSINVLRLQSLEDITIDLLNEEDNVEALANVMGEVYKSDLLKDPFVDFMKDKINGFVEDYNVEFTKEELLSIDTKEEWENEFTNINKVLNVDFSDESNITKDNLKTVFDAVEEMDLFKSKKVAILKYAVKNSNFLTEEEYNSISWPNSTNQEDIDAFWNNETSVLLNVIDKKETIETLTTSVDLQTLDVSEIGELLNETMKSDILSVVVVDKIVDLLKTNGINHDDDTGESTVNLENSIKSVSDWSVELAIIKNMLNMTSDTFDDKVHGVTAIETMFEDIDNSELLSKTKANLLIKAIEILNIDGISTDEVSVDILKATYNGETYYQYNNEVDVFISFAENRDIIESLTDITSLTGDNKIKVAGLLDKLEFSTILSGKYETTIDNSLAEIKKEQALQDYNVSFKSAEEARDVEWDSEIDRLISIKDTISVVAGYTSSSVVSDRETTLANIGATLDAVEASAFLGSTQADKIADEIVTILTKDLSDDKKITNITKETDKSWKETFDSVLASAGL